MKGPAVPSAAELKELFAARGISPSRALGQNFLVDARAMRAVVRDAALDPHCVVLEPGAGTGGLTALMACEAAAVVAVELDRKLEEIARERLAGLPGVRLIHSDILGRDGAPARVVTQCVRAALAEAPGRRLKVVANLPYSVSTPLITALLTGETIPEEMVVTVQREVADRLGAAPGTEAYGYLSVIAQAVARVARLRELSPQAFWPQPAVHSAVIRITPDAQLRAAAGDVARLRRLAGALFTHRRKQLAALLVRCGLAAGRDDARRFLSQAALAETLRPEELSVAQFIALARLMP